MTQEADMRISALEGRIAQLADRVDALSAENDTLRGLRHAGGDSGAAVGSGHVSRRGLLAAAVGATGAMLVTRAAPAAAADGDSVLAGQETAATNTTRVVASTGHGLDGVTTSSVDGRAGVEGKASATTGLTYGMKGKSLSNRGIGVFGEATAASGDTTGVWGESDSDRGVGVFGSTPAVSGETYGVWGKSDSSDGTGVLGEVVAASGRTFGVWGKSHSANGAGVVGEAVAATGRTFGVYGKCDSDSGFALYGQGGLKATGRCYLGAPAGRPNDNLLTRGGISFYLDPQSDRLKVRVKYPNGALKTGSIPLV